MEDLVKTCGEELPFKVSFQKNFVDDIITSVPKEKTQTTLNCFNSYFYLHTVYNSRWKWKIPFLDTKAVRKENEIKLRWYNIIRSDTPLFIPKHKWTNKKIKKYVSS